MAVHECCKYLHISMPSSAKQKHEMSKFKRLVSSTYFEEGGERRRLISYFHVKMNAGIICLA